ncbi:MAG: DUF4384 domain-containing protein [Bacteroidetes bacterium]|nr:MAG: DUF4384 domain-containing protein [Bacteroidota bacterium]
MSFLRPLLCLLLAGLVTLSAQEKGKWVTGKAAVFGTNFAAMETEAVKRARADALNQAGIVVSASSYRVQTEDNKDLSDYYSAFTEASSRGIITEERNVRISDPVRVTKSAAKGERLFQVEAQLEAFVVVPDGAADPGFSLSVRTKRTTYRESEPVLFDIVASRDCRLTIINVKSDTIQVLFPNGLTRDNRLGAKQKFLFPEGFDLYLTVDGDAKSSTEEFILVVTKDDVPVAEVKNATFSGDELVLPKLTLTDLSRWLAKIPLDRRTMDHIVLSVVK